jgi:hypothetical protein
VLRLAGHTDVLVVDVALEQLCRYLEDTHNPPSGRPAGGSAPPRGSTNLGGTWPSTSRSARQRDDRTRWRAALPETALWPAGTQHHQEGRP